tara:strand:- start:46 stop:261 length:216 start_codon:yes stop_codon:yes gene_type:complete
VAPIIDKIIKTILLFLSMVLISLIWIVINWPYTPQDAIDDGIRLGPYGILVDIGLILCLLVIWLRNRESQE